MRVLALLSRSACLPVRLARLNGPLRCHPFPLRYFATCIVHTIPSLDTRLASQGPLSFKGGFCCCSPPGKTTAFVLATDHGCMATGDVTTDRWSVMSIYQRQKLPRWKCGMLMSSCREFRWNPEATTVDREVADSHR